MCKYCGSAKSKKLANEEASYDTFETTSDVSSDGDLVVIAAKSPVNIDTPYGKQFLRSGAFLRVPRIDANKLVEQGAPIWIT